MTFTKGTSGNPRGRPKKGAATADFIRYAGELKYHGTDQTYRERAVLALWEQAAKGYLPALQFIVERTEGKAPEEIKLTGTMTHEHHGGLTDEERVERLAALYERVRARLGGDAAGGRSALDAPAGAAE